MLDQLINLVKEQAGDAIVNNPEVPNQHNNAVIEETATTIMNTMKGHASSGNMNDITSLLKGGNTSNNPLVSIITQQVSSKLTSKFGLSNNAVNSVVSNLIPTVMSKLSHKTNDPEDNSFSFEGIMGAIGGGNDILGNLKNLF
jgi:uncharacterized protein YidB (DUF937 family)